MRVRYAMWPKRLRSSINARAWPIVGAAATWTEKPLGSSGSAAATALPARTVTPVPVTRVSAGRGMAGGGALTGVAAAAEVWATAAGVAAFEIGWDGATGGFAAAE